MWRFAILEIYSSGDKFPSWGTPAEWIENKDVSYCDATPEDLAWIIPVYAFLWWKFIYLLKNIRDFFEFTVWDGVKRLFRLA